MWSFYRFCGALCLLGLLALFNHSRSQLATKSMAALLERPPVLFRFGAFGAFTAARFDGLGLEAVHDLNLLIRRMRAQRSVG
jgi:hypothetical protein